jgi:hypothetical protein
VAIIPEISLTFSQETMTDPLLYDNIWVVVHSHPAICLPTVNCVAYQLRPTIELTAPYGDIETLTQPSTGCPPTCIIQSSQLKA